MTESRLVSSFILGNLSDRISNGSFPATVLLADMTGFTRLTDQAMRLGDGGAEWISSILSRSFSPFIEFVEEEGGFIAEFEGDAALAVFHGDRPELLPRSQQLLEDVSKKVGEGITFSVSSGSGDVHWGISGSDGILYQLFYGASVADAFSLDYTLPSTNNWKKAVGRGSRFFPLQITGKEFGGEFRTVFSAFLSLQISSVQEAQGFFKSVCDFTSAMDGLLNGTYLRGKRATALVVFGAPRAHESDARRCGELVTGLMKLFPSLQAGISADSAYAGFIGSENRCDYTVLGSRVNLASRLCGRAEEGDIFVNRQYMELVRHYFNAEQGRMLHLKGFAEPQQCYRISDSVTEAGNDFRSGRFVGRVEERKALLDLFSSSVHHRELSTVNIFGEPGIGKSRLLDNCIASCGQDVFKLVLSGDELMSATDLLPWKKALKYVSKRLFSHLLKNAKLEDLFSELKWAEGCLIRLSDDSRETVSNENLTYSVSVLLDSIARTGRFMIGVDNPGSMDTQSLNILESFLDRQESARGLVVSTCRLEAELPEFLRSGTSIDLGPFSVQETIEKLSVDTGFTVVDSIAKILHKRSAGNPLYLEELSSMVQQDQLKGTWSTWQNMEQILPASLGSLLESRIDRLSGEMREAVNAASVLGQEFDPEILRHMMPVRSASITKGLSLGIWKISRQGKLVFRQDLIRQTSYRMLLVSKRKSIHRLAADVIIKLHPEPEGEHLVSLAMHAAKADYSEIALKYLETAGDHCRQGHRNQQAIDLYTYLEQFSHDSDTRMRARGKKGAVLEVVGRWSEALDIYRTSIDLADKDSSMVQDSCRMRISMGRLLMEQGRFDEAISVLERAQSFLHEDQEILLGSVYANLGGSWLRKGEYRIAGDYLEKWREITERSGDKYTLAMVMGTLGVLAAETGEADKAKEYYNSQAELAEQTGQDFLVSISIHNLGNIAMQSGDLDLAETCFKKDLKITRELGYRSSESVTMGTLSRVFCYKGNYDKALEFARFHLRVSQVLDNRFREVSAFNNVVTVQIYSGSYSDAEETLRQRDSVCKLLGIKEESLEGYYLHSLLEIFKEEFHSAVRWLEYSLEFAEENHLKMDLLYYSILGVLYLLTNNRTEAQKCLAKAEELIAVPADHGGDACDKLISIACKHADPILEAKVTFLTDQYCRT